MKAVSWSQEYVLKYLRCCSVVLISTGPSFRFFFVLTGEMMHGNKSVNVNDVWFCLLATPMSAVYLVLVGSRL